MIIFIVGGAKSSKSSFGEVFSSKLNNQGKLYYLATMNPYDCEDLKRINDHIENRKEYGFVTIEQKRDLHNILEKLDKDDTVLLDSITSLVTNEMFVGKEFNSDISIKISDDIKKISQKVKNIVIVSDYVFSDGILYDSYTERFKRELGHINCSIASMADIVVESSFGSLIIHKGMEMAKSEKFI